MSLCFPFPLKVGVSSKKVAKEYFNLIEKLGNEFKILMDTPIEDIGKAGNPQIAEAISRMRKGEVHIAPGFDGEYGKIKIFEEVYPVTLKKAGVERKKAKGQARLF